MKRVLFVLLSLVLAASLLLSACATPTPTAAPEGPDPAPESQSSEKEPAGASPTRPTGQEATEPPAGGEESEPDPQPEPASTTDRKGGWLDRIVFSAIKEYDTAVAQLEAGAIDMYADKLEDAALYEKVKANPELEYINSFGSYKQMLLNTEPCADGSLNPFSSQRIREAMNWAIDRNYITQEIQAGMGVPKFTPVGNTLPDHARYAAAFAKIETAYSYDFEKAMAVVTEEMTAMGATLNAAGKWEFNGEPVKLIGLIRTEDARREIGNYFANQLEELGFTVERQEKTSAEAGPIWQGEDVEACKFHFYTAGWGATGISRDEGQQFAQFNTNRMQDIPLFRRFAPSAELAAVEDPLFINDFSTMEERDALFTKALELSMQESWWGTYISEDLSFTPFDRDISVAYDLAAGIGGSRIWPYTLRWEDKEGGEMRIAQSSILVQPWNPIAGSNWEYDAMIQNAAMDWAFVWDPYTGLALPKLLDRATVEAVEGLPIRKSLDYVDLVFSPEPFEVPEDAWADWDAENQRWITVGEKYPEGVTSKIHSTVYYIPELWDTTWHDGSRMSIADFVMSMILQFDLGKPESPYYNESLASGVETYLSHLKGFRIVSTDPLVIETWDDQYQLDAELSYTPWFPSTYLPANSSNGMMAWHNLTPALMAEANGEIAMTTEKAGEKEIEWTSLISGPSLEIQAKYLEQAKAEGLIPYAPTLSEFLTPDEVAARYENLSNWYAEHGHMYLGTGPYYVDQVFPVEGSITLNRYEDYIFPADVFSYLSEPRLPQAEVEGPLQVQAGTEAVFDVFVSFEGEAYPAEDIETVSYVLFNARNEAVGSGSAELVADGVYEIILDAEITGGLEAGASKLAVVASSKVVSIAGSVTYEFVVTD